MLTEDKQQKFIMWRYSNWGNSPSPSLNIQFAKSHSIHFICYILRMVSSGLNMSNANSNDIFIHFLNELWYLLCSWPWRVSKAAYGMAFSWRSMMSLPLNTAGFPFFEVWHSPLFYSKIELAWKFVMRFFNFRAY